MSTHDCVPHLYRVDELNTFRCSVDGSYWKHDAEGNYHRVAPSEAKPCPACEKLLVPEVRGSEKVWPSHAVKPWVECKMSGVLVP
jgi:hypothetical protein